ncbi:hypothetical protein ABMA70_10305 [Halobacteriovorax sp. XZX-3]|uniref:hypothetical protein n=1 Tax=unclassified Halobacteriovorax TaxID=2639665 RepID=UPI000CD0B84E|nr:hypothetical protein [Halobacteriovorax sp. DA5]POB13021.1 hypothetical protein C0Z22_10900 [Halobacteriovorax sp. DA5]
MNRLSLFFLCAFLIGCSGNNNDWHGGADANSNGVRDDIDSWIEKKANGNERLKNALVNLAKINPAKCEYSIKAKCLDQLSEDGILLQIELLDLQLNTKELRAEFEGNIKNCPQIDDRKINYKCDL